MRIGAIKLNFGHAQENRMDAVEFVKNFFGAHSAQVERDGNLTVFYLAKHGEREQLVSCTLIYGLNHNTDFLDRAQQDAYDLEYNWAQEETENNVRQLAEDGNQHTTQPTQPAEQDHERGWYKCDSSPFG